MLNRLILMAMAWGAAVLLFLINWFIFEGIMEIGWVLPPLIVLPFIKKGPVHILRVLFLVVPIVMFLWMQPGYTYEQAIQEFGSTDNINEQTTIPVNGVYSFGLKHRFYYYSSNQKSYMIHPQTGEVMELEKAYWK